MADEAPLTLRNRAAHPERGYQPEPSIDAALGGAFNTSGRSNLLAEEVNEVTDTEDEDQELTPPGVSANDREEQTEAPNRRASATRIFPRHYVFYYVFY